MFRWTIFFIATILVSRSKQNSNFTSTFYINAFEALGESAFGVKEKIGRNVELKELKLILYTSQNRGHETYLDPLNPVELISAQGKIFFLLHGWIDSRKLSHWYNELTNRLLHRYPIAQIVQVDWESASFQDFGLSTYSTESIGSHLATLISNLVDSHYVPTENIILIGHSLGAHICGWTGKYFTQLTNKKVGRIIGLDPAGLLFNERPDSRRLNRNDAEVVHVIHTDSKKIGFSKRCGTIDFFPNGGHDQPGCSNIDLQNPFKLFMDVVFCNHFRSFEFFLEAIGSQGSLLGHKCFNEESLEARRCNGTEVALGDLETFNEGLYYLETNDKPPYSKLSIQFR